MATDIVPVLRTALRRLETEKARIDRQVAALRTALASTDTSTVRVRRRTPMSAAARKAIARRMKAYWAKRKAAGRK